MKIIKTKFCEKRSNATLCREKDDLQRTMLDALSDKKFINKFCKLIDLTQFATKLEVPSSFSSKQKNAKYDRAAASETGKQAASSSSVQNNTASAQFPSTSKVSPSRETKIPNHHRATNTSMENKGNGNRNTQMPNCDEGMTESSSTNLVSVKCI